jgi:hypothetical protein
MTLYRLLSGRDPLEADDLVALRKYSPSHFNAHISPALEQLILCCINANPQRRPADGGEFVRALDRVEGKAASVSSQSTQAAHADEADEGDDETGLTFSDGSVAQSIQEFIRIADKQPREAQEYLFNGELEAWLVEINRGILARRAREIREKYSRRERGLEAFLQATGEVEPPQMKISSDELDFGEMEAGQHRSLRLHVRNPGRGFLFGVLRSSHDALHVPHEFDGNDVALQLTLDTRRLERGVHGGRLIVDSSAGELQIPFRVTVKRGETNALSSVVSWSTLGMLGGFAVRTLPLAPTSPWPGWNWLHYSQHLHWWPAAPLFGGLLWIALLPFVASECMRRRSCSFTLSVVLFATLLCMACGALGLEILVGGDDALRETFGSLTPHWAAGAWLFLGGIGGAAFETLRRWKLIFSSRLIEIVGGWLVALAIIYGLLAAAQFLAPHQ